jgi:glutathione peroxidase-family protein
MNAQATRQLVQNNYSSNNFVVLAFPYRQFAI